MSETTLANGSNQLVWQEDVRGKVGKGEIDVPAEFVLGIPVFEGGAKYQVTCFLRYRIEEGGKLCMWFDIHKRDEILADAFEEIVKVVREGVSAFVMYGRLVVGRYSD